MQDPKLKAEYNRSYYACNADKLKTALDSNRKKMRAREIYRADPEKRKAASRIQYRANPNKKRAASRAD